jgi:hypothetical protein
MNKKAWDVFISHASEDKDDIARPLAEALADLGLSVWFDENELLVGDSLSRAIDHGLSKSNFGIVILSKHFLEKNWPEYELRGLTAKEIGRDKVILPIWHRVSREEILKFSPTLADKFALQSSQYDIVTLGIKLAETINPEIFNALLRKSSLSMQEIISPKVSVRHNSLKSSPTARHKDLPEELVGRIKLIRAALLEVFPDSIEGWIDSFKADTHPSREVAVWEKISAAYLELIQLPDIKQTDRQSVYSILLAMSSGIPIAYVKHNLPQKVLKLVKKITSNYKPFLNPLGIVFVPDGKENTSHPIEDFSGPESKISQAIVDEFAFRSAVRYLAKQRKSD